MARTLFALAVSALIAAPAFAEDTKYTLSGDNTKLTFIGTKTGGKHEGGFKKLSGTATVTDGKLETLKIEVNIDCDSLFTDDEKLTAHLKSPDFFSVKDNPKATFKTTKVEKIEKGHTVTGDLTLLGKTKPVTFNASMGEKDGMLVLGSTFIIDRTDWGMTFGKGKVDDKVTLKLLVTAKK